MFSFMNKYNRSTDGNQGRSLMQKLPHPHTRSKNLTVKYILLPGKSYTGEGSASFEKLEKPVWRPKERQLNKFRSMPSTTMKKNCCI